MSECSQVKIRIQQLSKIFGPSPESALLDLQRGVAREELLEKRNHVLALDNINMTLLSHSIEVVMGLSGSGKSTLIRHLNQLIKPTDGQVIVDDVNICQLKGAALRQYRQQKTAMVFQNFALLPHKTIVENIGFGLKVQKKSAAKIKETSFYWLDRVGLSRFANHYPYQLSGGMQQRVGLARALACDAEILLMDEAFSALDPLIRSDMQDILLELQKELKKTIVFITHDLDEALKIGDRIAILNEGRLVQQGTAEDVLLHPADDYVKRFVADVNRTSILLAKSIMVDCSNMNVFDLQAVKVQSDDTVQQVIHRMLSEDVYHAVVTNDNGQPIGRIDSDIVAQAVNY